MIAVYWEYFDMWADCAPPGDALPRITEAWEAFEVECGRLATEKAMTVDPEHRETPWPPKSSRELG